MNDTATAPVAPKSSRKFFLPVVIAIIAIGAIGYLASKMGLDRALVKESVDHFAADLQSSSNDTLNFSYKDIKIEGGWSDRHAVLIEPKLEQSPQGLESEEKIIYTTEAALLYAGSSDLSSLKIVLPHPIKGYKAQDTSGEVSLTVTQRTPFEIEAEQVTINGKPFIASEIKIPDSLLVDGPQSERGEAWNQFTVSSKPGALVKNTHSTAPDAPQGLGSTEIMIEELVLTPENNAEGAISVAKVASNYSNSQTKSGSSSVAVTADVGPITGSASALPYGPIHFTMDMKYEGLLSSAPEDFANDTTNEKSLKLETFNLKAKDAALYATADFVSGAKDVLPVGTANITIENAPFILDELRKNGVLDQKNEAMLSAVTQQITGKKLGEEKDVSIDVKRVRDGAFQIGNTTFEELMAIVLRAAFSNKMPASEPQATIPAAPAVTETQKEEKGAEEPAAPATEEVR